MNPVIAAFVLEQNHSSLVPMSKLFVIDILAASYQKYRSVAGIREEKLSEQRMRLHHNSKWPWSEHIVSYSIAEI